MHRSTQNYLKFKVLRFQVQEIRFKLITRGAEIRILSPLPDYQRPPKRVPFLPSGCGIIEEPVIHRLLVLIPALPSDRRQDGIEENSSRFDLARIGLGSHRGRASEGTEGDFVGRS